jgi:hypothetical protein
LEITSRNQTALLEVLREKYPGGRLVVNGERLMFVWEDPLQAVEIDFLTQEARVTPKADTGK